jgi:hypothetical protein
MQRGGLNVSVDREDWLWGAREVIVITPAQ